MADRATLGRSTTTRPTNALETMRRSFVDRTWPWAIVFFLVAFALVTRSSAGSYVADNRFELYWNPGQRLDRSLGVWDSTRGLGRIRDDFRVGTASVIWIFRSLGASAAVAERLWHSVLIATGGAGMVAAVRCLVPKVRAWAGASGALFAFGPYSAVFLVPSTLYAHYALAPWLVVFSIRGVRSSTPWRWAALVAIAVFMTGNGDPPGLVYASVPAVIALVASVGAKTVRARRALGWLCRVAALSIPVLAAAVTKTVLSADAFAQRLSSTESPEVAATTSSWTESLRGLGFWVSYFRLDGDLVRPHQQELFSAPLSILVTAVPVVVALVALWLAPARVRLLFGVMLGFGGLLMVGGHAADDPSPWGAIWLWANERVPGFAALRSTYKAGATMVIGTAGLVAVAGGWASTRWPDRRRMLGVACAALVMAVAFPFWSSGLYSPEQRMAGDVPDYWDEALDWIDAQPGAGRVLILPGSTRSLYRWGSPGDDIHDALLRRDHLVDVAIPLTTPAPADLLEAIDDLVVDGEYDAGTIAPVLRRLGVEFVVLRNDLRWEAMGVPRPARYTTLRADPDLTPAATFGAPGQNTVGVIDRRSDLERSLPPVEILRVSDPVANVARSAPAAGWSLLEGGGAAWFRLASAGLLDGDAPVAYAAAMDDDVLASQLDGGGVFVVTDTNRRRSQSVNVYGATRSRTLADAEDLGRPIAELFDVPGAETVTTHRDAVAVFDPGEDRAVAGFRPHFRAAQALDGDLATGWVVPPIPDPTERSLRIDFRTPVEIDGVDVTAFDPRAPLRALNETSFAGVPRVARASLRLSTGEVHDINLLTGARAVAFAPTTVQWVELEILDVTAARDVGIAEVEFSGADLDLAEVVQTPDSTFRRASSSAGLVAALREVPMRYDFARDIGPALTPVENNLRRSFTTAGARRFVVTAVVGGVDELPTGCEDLGIRVDGDRVLVRADAASGVAGQVVGCETLALDAGEHRIEGVGDPTVDRFVMTSGARRPSATADASVDVLRRDDAIRTFSIDDAVASVLVTGDGFDDRWTASVDGRSLGSPIMLDTQTAWVVPSAGSSRIDVRFGPARWFRLSLVVTGVGLLASTSILARAAWRRRR